jgi:adenylate cyclase class 2
MSDSEKEIEAKFFVRDLAVFEQRLQEMGAKLTAERVFERNLRFDNREGDLNRERQALRLRQDANAVMTFKGPSREGASVSERLEIEFQVSDFNAARRLLEALGYEVAVIYEKYRTTYSFGELEVVLDELPFGRFIEIEGPSPSSIRRLANALGLRWEVRSSASYLALFYQVRAARGLAARNLTFEEFEGIVAAPKDLALDYAG